jgi:hypothetical protein
VDSGLLHLHHGPRGHPRQHCAQYITSSSPAFTLGLVVGPQVAQRVLHAGEQMLHQRLDRVDPLAVAERHVEQPALPVLLDPAQREVVVRPWAALLELSMKLILS